MKLGNIIQHWFFAEIDIRQYALLRIGIGTLILIYLYQLMPLASLHFSSDGWLGNSPLSNGEGTKSWSLLFLFTSASQTQIFWLLAMMFAGGFLIGLHTRTCGWITWIALVSIWHRNPLLLDGDDAILRMTLLYLIFAPCGNAFAIDAIGKKPVDKFPIWPLRMIQLQLAIVYFVSGWVKFQSQQWLDGSILQVILMHPQYSRWNFSLWVEQYWFTTILAWLSHIIRWWEILFPVLLWQRYTRCLCIVIGILFHLGLLVFMHLRWFPIIMLILYIALLPNTWFRKNIP